MSDTMRKGINESWIVRTVYGELLHPSGFPCRIAIGTKSVWKIESNQTTQMKRTLDNLKTRWSYRFSSNLMIASKASKTSKWKSDICLCRAWIIPAERNESRNHQLVASSHWCVFTLSAMPHNMTTRKVLLKVSHSVTQNI